MPRINLNQLSTSALKSDSDLFSQLRTILDDAERQFNNQTLVTSRLDNKNEIGMRKGDIIFRYTGGNLLQVGVWTGKRNRYLSAGDLGAMLSRGLNFFGFAQDTTAFNAAATQTKYFPNNGDWGFYKNTAGPTFHLVYNDNGTTKGVAM